MSRGVFGIAAVLAVELVAKGKRTSAIAFMFSGLTIANSVNVPAGIWFSYVILWRAIFYLMTFGGCGCFSGKLSSCPREVKHHDQFFRNELVVFGDINVLIAMGSITVLGQAAFFTSITYIAPMAGEIGYFSDQDITFLLFIFSAVLFVGNYFGGKLADRALMPVLYITPFGQGVVMFFRFFLLAAFGFASVSPIQRLVMDKANAVCVNLASAVNIDFFNLGNALGLWLDGFVLQMVLAKRVPIGLARFCLLPRFCLPFIHALLHCVNKSSNGAMQLADPICLFSDNKRDFF